MTQAESYKEQRETWDRFCDAMNARNREISKAKAFAAPWRYSDIFGTRKRPKVALVQPNGRPVTK